jgi:hypothetical protein
MTFSALIALLLLQLKHFLFDFPLQTQYQSKNKGTYGHPGGILHSGLHIAGTAAVLAFFQVSLPLLLAILAAEFLVHYHTDWVKARMVKRFAPDQGPRFWSIFGLDQFVHHVTYVAIVFVVLNR